MKFEYLNNRLDSYIERLGEKTPCPGGGSASILAAALAAALVKMTGNYTVAGRNIPEESAATAERIVAEASILQAGLNASVEKDSYLYENIREASNEARKDPSKKEALDGAVRNGISLHVEILAHCEKITGWNEILAEKGNPYLLSDAGVSAALILGVMKATRINILVNLQEIRDQEYIGGILDKIEPISASIEKRTTALLSKIEKKFTEAANGG